MAHAETVGYDRLRAHYPALFAAYALGEARATKFFAHPYRDMNRLVERARKAAAKGIEKPVLEALKRYHAELGAPLEALEKLGRGAAAVVTGQQPSVGWGPLYNLHKAAGAIRLARAIEAKGVPCVALFWNHSDDTRGGDVVSFPDRDNKVRDLPLPPGEAGVPLYEAGSPEALGMFASALGQALPSTEFKLDLAEVHRGSIAESFSRALLRELGRSGLIVAEPRHLEGERSARFFADHLADPSRLSRAVEAGRKAVVAEGFPDHLGREVGLDLFEIRGGRRARVEKPGPVKGRLSAGVALRPLLQDAVLPVAAYVGGPSEVGYQAELLPAYREFGIEPPVVFPRVTATLVEPKIARAREKAGLGAAELFAEEASLLPRFVKPDEDVAGALGKLPGRWMGEVGEALKRLPPEPSLQRAREKTEVKVREALEALAARVRDEESRQGVTGRGQLTKLLTHVRPGGKLQERVFTPYYYAALFGPDVFGTLVESLDPFAFAHQVVTLP